MRKWLTCTERRARELRIRQLRLALNRSATCAPGCMPRDITRGRWCARCAPRGRRSARVLLAVSRRETRAVNRHQLGGAVDGRLHAGQPRGPPSITSERRRAPLYAAGALGGGSAIAACRGVRFLPAVFRSGTSALVVACWLCNMEFLRMCAHSRGDALPKLGLRPVTDVRPDSSRFRGFPA